MERDKLPADSTQDRFKLTVEDRTELFSCACNQTLLQALTAEGIFLEANCGGRGTCGKCKISVHSGKVAGRDGVPIVAEADCFQLACQVYPCEDITIKLSKAETSAKGTTNEFFNDDGQPLIKKRVLSPEYPTVEDNYSLQEMICRALNTATLVPENFRTMKQLAGAVELSPGLITAVAVGEELISFESGDTADCLFGIAFDIGTTTVVGMLVDANMHRIIATCAETNPQAAFGADVISRIHAASDPGLLEAQTQAIRQCLNRLIEELCKAGKISRDHVYAITIAGNTTMAHLLMQISPQSLVIKPYVSVFQQLHPFSSDEIGLTINPDGRVILLPMIASFIGADTTAAILATNQDTSSGQSLLIDLGTNGEIVLGNRDRLFACSTAAGPAFEGAHIRDGMRAAPGAIEDVTVGEDIIVRTIGGSKAAGICGSGLVKAVAELVKKKIITATGRFDKTLIASQPDNLSRRLINRDKHWEYVLVEGSESTTGKDISITQADIRQIQLVKSAICTGIQILMEKAGLKEDLSVFLAGAFGNYMDVQSALTIGLLPGFSQEQVQPVGNAAGEGAVQALLSREKLARCVAITQKIHYIELAAEPEFQNKFIANLAFP